MQRDVGAPLVNWRGELVGVALQQSSLCGVPGQPTAFTNLARPDLNEWVRTNVDVEPPPDDGSDLETVTGKKRL